MRTGQTPTDIAERWDVSPQHGGRVITSLGIGGDARYCMTILNKARNSNKTVKSYVYNHDGVALIESALGRKN